MSRNGIPNQLNASLIREVRMIAQQFFRSKENSTFWETYHGRTKAAAPTPPTLHLKCARCFGLRKSKPDLIPKDAVTMFEGTAVCEDHI